MRTSSLNCIIEVSRRIVDLDTWGQPSTGFNSFLKTWALKVETVGKELESGDSTIYVQQAFFIVRKADFKIKIDDRLNEEKDNYFVTGVREIQRGRYKGNWYNSNECLEIACEKILN